MRWLKNKEPESKRRSAKHGDEETGDSQQRIEKSDRKRQYRCQFIFRRRFTAMFARVAGRKMIRHQFRLLALGKAFPGEGLHHAHVKGIDSPGFRTTANDLL